jgi:hypothetical protein
VELNFEDAISVRAANALVEIPRLGVDQAAQVATIPSSGVARGLTLKSLRVDRNWDGLWGLLRRKHQFYFMTIAFDMSENPLVILPPEEVPESAIYEAKSGEIIEFTLGSGAPVFPSRVIYGGLLVYMILSEADRGVKHVGEVMSEVHKDLKEEGSITKLIKNFIANPAKTVIDEVLGAATAALQPIATILRNYRDDHVALFSGVFPVKGPWEDCLTATRNGATIELSEIRD